MSQFEHDAVSLTPEQKKSRRGRSLAIGLALGALVALLYIITVVKLGPAVLKKPL